MRTRWKLAIFASAALAAGVPVLVAGPGGAHRAVGATEFVALMRRGPSSTESIDFLGVDGDRAYASRWRMGFFGGETTDVYSVAIDELPAPERDALRDGRNPWQRHSRTNDPGLRPAEHRALEAATRLPAQSPIVVLLRCAIGKPAEVARDHFDARFTTDDIVPIPVPCDLLLVVTADEAASVSVGGEEWAQGKQPQETISCWHHLRDAGDLEVAVRGITSTWRVDLRRVPAADFYTVEHGHDRAKR
jgi:hypothetical protein